MEIYDWDTLTPFETNRQKNIIRNYEFMKACGLPVKPLVYVKRVDKPLEELFKYLSDESSSEDEEWTEGPIKKKDDPFASKDIRKKVTNPTAFFKQLEKEKREEKEKQERAASENAVDDQIASSSSTSSSASLRGSTPSSSSKKVVVKKKPSRVLVKKANGKQFIKERPKLPTAPTEMVEPENHEERPLRRKCPQRGPRIDYTETDDDHFLFCQECQHWHEGECPLHISIRPIADTATSSASTNKALQSLPVGMEVKQSSIEGAGLGVFATKFIESGAWFGPYRGEKVRADIPMNPELDTSYMWEMVKDHKVECYINGKDEKHANWMRYVNCSRVEQEQNMVALQFHGKIWYRTYKDVAPGVELLVWYGEEYAVELGIALQDDDDKITAEVVVHKCEWCGLCYTHKEDLPPHQKRCKKMPIANPVVTVPTSEGDVEGASGSSVDVGGGGKYRCDLCGKVFVTPSALNNHRRYHTGERPFPCLICGKRFIEKGHLKVHTLTHSMEKPHKCSTCGRGCLTNSALTQHMRTHTSGSSGASGSSVDVGGGGARTHRCDLCGKAFVTPAALNNHRRYHTGERPFPCLICGKSFTEKGHLKLHTLIHTKEKAHKCATCGREFISNGNLKLHMRTHSGVMRFKCEVCGKEFKWSTSLRNHVSRHTGVYIHQCDECEFKTNNAADLKTHTYSHSDEKPYHCHVCGRGFAQKGNMKKHVRLVHNTKEK